MSSAVMRSPRSRALHPLREMAAAPDLNGIDAQAAAKGLLQMMEELSHVLRAYFYLEEVEDHVAIADAAPQLHPRICALQQEHRSLHARLERFLASSKPGLQGGGNRGTCQRVLSWFERFEQELCRHESRERQLLYDAYWKDVGVGD